MEHGCDSPLRLAQNVLGLVARQCQATVCPFLPQWCPDHQPVVTGVWDLEQCRLWESGQGLEWVQ